MDDEDLAELRDSRQLVDENDEMDFVRGGTASELRRRTGADGEQEEEEYVLPSLTMTLEVLTRRKPASQLNHLSTSIRTRTTSPRLSRCTHT